MSNSFDTTEKKENFFAKWINLYGREKIGSFFVNFLSVNGVMFLVCLLVSILTNTSFSEDNTISNIMFGLWLLILVWFIFVFGIRRARDVGFTGRGYFVFTILPLVGIIIWFLPTNFLAKEKAGFFFRKKDTNQTVMQEGYFNQQHPQHGMQGGYANQQYTQNPQQMNGMQGGYANQQYTQNPQQMNGMPGGYANQQYTQNPQQMNGMPGGYANQQYTQNLQQVNGMPGGYANQQYTQNPQQVNVTENGHTNQQSQ